MSDGEDGTVVGELEWGGPVAGRQSPDKDNQGYLLLMANLEDEAPSRTVGL